MTDSNNKIYAIVNRKGGVGKSTVSVNLTCALAKLGQRVGILDADVYGPNVPMMLDLEGARPKPVGQKIAPLMRDDIKVMSLGFLAPSDEAIIWRGPLVGRAIEQMLRDVDWGELDFLIIDLPPGTGDAQLTISQRLELAAQRHRLLERLSLGTPRHERQHGVQRAHVGRPRSRDAARRFMLAHCEEPDLAHESNAPPPLPEA